mmetsp:Transcript_18930/g.34317  ORF Transcript_18930/g.34317 Transcript_18930/m.34317 type:complete len:233 (-) Transcript_18930:4278-4976(-)
MQYHHLKVSPSSSAQPKKNRMASPGILIPFSNMSNKNSIIPKLSSMMLIIRSIASMTSAGRMARSRHNMSSIWESSSISPYASMEKVFGTKLFETVAVSLPTAGKKHFVTSSTSMLAIAAANSSSQGAVPNNWKIQGMKLSAIGSTKQSFSTRQSTNADRSPKGVSGLMPPPVRAVKLTRFPTWCDVVSIGSTPLLKKTKLLAFVILSGTPKFKSNEYVRPTSSFVTNPCSM